MPAPGPERLAANTPGDAAQFRLGLQRRHRRRQSANHLEPAAEVPRFAVLGGVDDRNPERASVRKLHVPRHDSHDGVGLSAQRHRCAENRRVAAISRLPQAVTEDGDLVGFRHAVIGTKITSEQRPLSDQRKRIRRHQAPLYPVRCAAFVSDGVAVGHEGGEPLERSGLRAILQEILVENATPVPALDEIPTVDVDDLPGVLERKGLEQRRVVDGEHHAVHTDAKRDRDHGRQRESRALRKDSPTESNVRKDAHLPGRVSKRITSQSSHPRTS